jgi:hydroxymethylbilane synthase
LQAASPRTGAIRIGTRGSPLALKQAHEARDRLAAAHGMASGDLELRVIKTSGDRIQDRALAEAGGKGLFTKEIEEALLAGEIDLAVHSMKDVPTVLPPGLAIKAVLPREDVRDAFISRTAPSIAALPKGARIGSASLRRQAQLRHLRPDLEVVNFRGNVETRLRKLEEGQVAATLLACAGLKRLGLEHVITARLSTEDILPAVGQGAIAIEARDNDEAIGRLLAAVDDRPTALCLAAERAFLARLDGSCRTPIAGLGEITNGRLRFRGMILLPDGSRVFATQRDGAMSDGERMGREAAEELLRRAGPDWLKGLA